ncbi:unnamed protein product [Brachionus calyciflorus]|uniref:Transmembrane protein n=1 Tax=Brachionus calyciflorus TaxID=104777 RepID=A0A813ZF81_9BILA|nr:unnamed protein product [Brachionus calyciflorus]
MKRISDLKKSNPIIYLFLGIFLIILAISMTAYPIAMIVMGSTNLNKCTIEPKIPVWLIVSGSVSIFMAILIILSVIAQVTLKKVDTVIVSIISLIVGIVGMFQFAWFITGNVWVYSKNGLVDYNDTQSASYCDQSLYLFTFWTINVAYIFMGIAILASILIPCIICCFSICCCSK